MPQLTVEQALQLATAAHNAGRLGEAEAIYHKILAADPHNANALHLLGVLAHQAGKDDEAERLIRRAIAVAPHVAQYHTNLGVVFGAAGRLAESLALHRRAVAVDGNVFEGHFNLGVALAATGDLDGAADAFACACRIRADSPEAHHQMADALRARGRLDEAAAAYRTAIALRPDDAEAHNKLGIIFSERGLVDDAIAAYRRAIELNPRFSGAHNNLGNAMKDTGRITEAVACYRASLALEANPRVAGNLLYTIHFDPAYDARRLYEEHARWDERYARPLAPREVRFENDRSPDRRLRVGYVSLDLREHPVGRFMLPLLANHDHAPFEVYCYTDLTRPDAVTARLRGGADVWRETAGMADEALAALIRRDRIDVLVDLAMHMDGTRMLAFARKPAPVQATYLAYCSTTGLGTMDYRLTDPYLDPPGIDESVYSEKSVWLPRTYWCYEPPAAAAEFPISPPPAIANGHVTFGSMNNFGKAGAPVRSAWARLLNKVPGSKLILHCGEGSHRGRVLEEFRAAGVAPDRVRFFGRLSLAEYFAQYRRIDVALDTAPYPGGTTTCDALWMGVPVVTLAGPTAATRAGASLLTNVGLPELIAGDAGRYVEIAAALATDAPRLAELRANLRTRMAESPVMDAKGFARAVEEAFREMWVGWCRSPRS